MNYKGFSLVELAASLVIIALVIAAISTSTNLIGQSELRSVMADLQNHKISYDAFMERYHQPPGDMENAATIWSANCAITITCNGNGSGVIQAIHQSSSDETSRAWKHLELAGLMNKTFITIPAAYLGVIIIGDMAPESKIAQSGYYMAGGSDIGGDTGGTIIASPWTDNYTNAVFLGKKSSSSTSNGLTIGAISAAQAFYIDKKMDDGAVDSSGNEVGFNTGEIRTRQDSAGGTSCINGALYNVSNGSKTCLIGYQLNKRN
jgi:prepilin-type N-terminal cleavage/methylation domain-containing protein